MQDQASHGCEDWDVVRGKVGLEMKVFSPSFRSDVFPLLVKCSAELQPLSVDLI